MPAAPPSLVEFRNVRKSYDGTTLVVRDLTLAVARGQFMTLLGPSGSGKTTTLMMLAGFERPDAGEIYLDGRSIAGLSPHRRGIGVVFQGFALFPHMSVAENVAFPLKVRRVGRAERETRVARALDMVRLAGLGGRKPSQLSGGQQQRVALARALVFEPRLVLLDEPLGALDKSLREAMQLEIRGLHQRLGVTLVHVTHDQAEAMTMSDRIAVFAGGVIRQLGTPRDLYARPENAFVARFIGENNALAGRVAAAGDDDCQVRLASGHVVEAVMGDAGEVGETCVVTIRPEHIAVAAESAEAMGERALPARLLESIYLGDHVRLRLELLDPNGTGPELIVKRPAEAASAGLANGEIVAVAWQPSHAKVFRPESGE
jgi:putative spermidine/putrescine transport system ATP-binding protein